MKKVAFLKHQDSYVAYFLDQKNSLLVSNLGKEILDYFFNEDLDLEAVVAKLQAEYNQSYDTIFKDAQVFLSDVYDRLQNNATSEVEQTFLSSPLGVEIEITSACNLRCKHCFQKAYQEEYMSLEKFCEIVDILAEKNVCEINLVGGEVFLHKDALKMIKYLANKGFVQTIVTNGIAMTDEIIAEISKLSRIYIMVSLDGTKELHDEIRGKGQFDKAMAVVKKIQAQNIPVELLCTLNNKNIHHVEEIVAFANEIKMPINFNLFKPFHDKQKDLIVKPTDFFATVEKLLQWRTEKNYLIGIADASLIAHLLGLPPRNECTATLAGLVIDMHGRMITCPYLVEAGYYEKSELPVFDENFVEHWLNHPMFVNFRDNGLKDCQARSYIFSNDVTGEDPYGMAAYLAYKNGQKGGGLND